jgi:hypothetical protein
MGREEGRKLHSSVGKKPKNNSIEGLVRNEENG